MIDITVPYYNDQENILKLLSSILMQTIVDKINVMIVDDCSDNYCFDIADSYRKLGLNINVFRSEQNNGPGIARQIGIDYTDSEFIMFADSDDCFYSVDSVEILYKSINEKTGYDCIWSSFINEQASINRTVKEQCTWVFSKIYRRSFLDYNKIRFDDSPNPRGNEDLAFNLKVLKCCEFNKQFHLGYIDDVTYYWKFNQNSITRNNNRLFEFDQCICQYVDNMIEVIDWLENKFGDLSQELLVSDMILTLYYMFYHICNNRNEFAKQAEWYVKKFYAKVIVRYRNVLKTSTITNSYCDIVPELTRSWRAFGYLPNKGILDFINSIDGWDEDAIKDIWREMSQNPETLKSMKNNVEKHLMPQDYWI